jgi:KDO2-lipid IV(A) lauroyltransferase
MDGDLRTGGAWTPRQRLKNDLLWILAAAAIAAARPLPSPVLRRLGRGLGLAVHRLARSPREIALANLAIALPALDDRGRAALARECFGTLGEALADTVLLLHGRGPDVPVDPAALAVLDAARREGRGVVFASAHLGPWERVAASLARAGVPLVALVRDSYDPRFSRLYERLRGRAGVHVVWRGRPGAAARIVRTLRGGGVLGIPMDLRARVPSCDVPFLGREAPTPVGPAQLALRLGAAVVVGTVAPRGSGGSRGEGLHVTATRISTDRLGTADLAARALTARINEELSRRILALPQAWTWPHPRWTVAPRTGV